MPTNHDPQGSPATAPDTAAHAPAADPGPDQPTRRPGQMAYAKRGGVTILESTRTEWPIEWRESYDDLSSVPCSLHGAQVGEACFQLRKRLTSFCWPQLFCKERGDAAEEIKKRGRATPRPSSKRDEGNDTSAFSSLYQSIRWPTTEARTSS